MAEEYHIQLLYRPETPPNTPQWARAAARQNEHNNRTLDSPQHHRAPHQPVQPHIEPLHFNDVPMPHLGGNPIVPDDPFALPGPIPGPAHFNGQQYGHLPQHLAQQLQNLPALPPVRRRGHGHVPPVSLLFFAFFSIS